MDDGIHNAKIISTDLGFHDGYGSVRNAWIHLQYGSSGQGFGGFVLGGAYTDAWVYGVLDALKCDGWEKLPGQFVRVRRENGLAVAIGHPLEDRWFEPKVVFAAMERT
jgi:hypothetical protein